MSTIPDRLKDILLQNKVTGIDFIYVHPHQRRLDVYFIKGVVISPALPGTLAIKDIQIYSPGGELPVIELTGTITWLVKDGQDVMRVVAKQPGDFSLYKFRINNNDTRIDSFYNDVTFSFKANCPSDLDCKPPDHECPPDDGVDFPINYLARDFWSFRSALLDFASLRYPDWTDRLEADSGIMMTEVMSALGDEMAYYQDRVNREAYLETATQRRSIRRHARLVDYNMHDGLGATAWLDFTVNSGNGDALAGTNVAAISENNTRIDFEVGHGIAEKLKNKKYNVDAARNEFQVHIWDEEQVCLEPGTTELYLEGKHAADLPFDDFVTDKITGKPSSGKWVLLKTNPVNAGQPIRTQLVRLIQITDTTDPVLGVDITHIVWEQAQALTFEFDMTILAVRGNMVPATAGLTQRAYFIINKDISTLPTLQLHAFRSPVGSTVERGGHDDTPVHLFTLPGSQDKPLVYLGPDAPDAKPEIALREVIFDGVNWILNPAAEPWLPQRSLLGVNSSEAKDSHFTLDDGTWQRVVGYQRLGGEFVQRDYAFDSGFTIRFGDGEFGKIPDDDTVFRVDYRLGGGRRSNVAAGTLKFMGTPLPFIASVTNPLPAKYGLDAETPNELRQLAPQAYQAVTYRAVRPEDYQEAAERLPWVQKAGASFRWTGSWITAFVTADPIGAVVLAEDERINLVNQLDRFRQAGREVDVIDPEYANIDLEIEICISPDDYPGEVKERVYEALLGKKGLRPLPGYFSPDRFTFGTFLDRSTLEAVIQSVTGVAAVEYISIARRGWFDWREFTELSYDPGKNVIIRIANDPLHPERGTLKLYTHGGL
jgi:hypothetical protein